MATHPTTAPCRRRFRRSLPCAAVALLAAFAVTGQASARTSDPNTAVGPTPRINAAAAPGSAVSNNEQPLSPGCRTVTTTIPSAVLTHQVVPIPVANLGQPAQLAISGRLCLPPGPAPKTVLLALHGITYTSQYWDVGYQPDTYSFARQAMHAGYGVYAIDRMGYGLSSHPLGALVTLDAQSAATHTIIGQLRAGKIGDHAFAHVVLVGHSLGTAIAWMESAQYNDADAVIGTSWASDLQTVPLIRFFSGFIPAQLDGKTAPQVGLDPSYLTSGPGGRNQNFLYDLSNVDPKMIDYDQDVLRSTVSAGEGATFYLRFNDIPAGQFIPTTSQEITVPLPESLTRQIRIPVFLDNGQNDLFFCGTDRQTCNSSQALQNKEATAFTPAACERAGVTPHAGHDVNLQENAPFTYGTILTWANQALGPDGNNQASYRAHCQAFSATNGTGGPGVFGAIPVP